jgi:hypothetical protein
LTWIVSRPASTSREQCRQHLRGLVGIVVDGLLAADDQAGAFLLGDLLQHLGYRQRLEAVLGDHLDRAVGAHGEAMTQGLLGLAAADRNHDDFFDNAGFTHAQRFLEGIFTNSSSSWHSPDRRPNRPL